MKNISKCRSILLLATVLSAAAAMPVTAQTVEDRRRSIQTTGEAVITAEPNRARIDVGVTTQAQTSQAAAEQNAARSQAVLTRLRTVIGQTGEIRTVGYDLTPNYTYPQQGGEPKLTGYTASNTVRVTLDDLTKVGSVIDTATQAGANQIRSLQFMLKDERPSVDQALRQASQNAMRKAEAIAAALGVKTIRVLSATESGGAPVPVREAFTMRAQVTQTPVEPGTIEVRGSVTLTVEIQ
jgi:Uncharacterized conserved protein